MSTLKVDGIRSNSATSDAITLADNGTCIVNITNNLSNRNLIINGAMQVAQRGTSSTDTGYGSVDRFGISRSGQDEAPEQRQASLGTGDTGPYELGFRKALKITNGNQTGGGGTGDYLRIYQFVEAQYMAQSGWNYTSTSSYLTVSCWVKSSVAQNFYLELRTQDGTQQAYVWETGNLTANTWTKITKTIPGHANIQIDNDNQHGPCLFIHLFNGTDMTGSMTLNQWAAYNTAIRTPDFGTANDDWYETNDSTFELTGVQMEVGDHATDYEHKRYHTELVDCQRYYEEIEQSNSGGMPVAIGQGYNTRKGIGYINFKVTKRVAPTAPNVNIPIDAGDTSHDSFFNTTTSGTTIRSSSSTNIGNADITSSGWTGKFSAEL